MNSETAMKALAAVCVLCLIASAACAYIVLTHDEGTGDGTQFEDVDLNTMKCTMCFGLTDVNTYEKAETAQALILKGVQQVLGDGYTSFIATGSSKIMDGFVDNSYSIVVMVSFLNGDGDADEKIGGAIDAARGYLGEEGIGCNAALVEKTVTDTSLLLF